MNTEKVWEEAKTDELVEGYKLYLDKDGEYNPKIYEAMAKVCNEKQELTIVDHRPKYFSLEKMPEPTEEELIVQKRADRDRLLQDSDISMLPDFPISAEEKELWLLYRQYLRDITKDPAFPNVDVLNFENWLGWIHSKELVLGE